MRVNKWTLGLAALGLVSLATAAQAEEKSMLAPLSGTTISGYVDTSAYWNPGTGNANPAPFAFNQGKQDGFNLDVVDLKVAKPLDETQWSAGYTLELMFGPDAPFITGQDIITGSGIGDNIRQAYVALRAPVGNGIDFKVGRFDSILGYESTDAYKNPNFTRSYAYTFTPREHTGVLAETKLADWISLAAGVSDIADNGFYINERNPRAESAKAYMGSVTLTAPESFGFLAGSALYAGVLDGFGTADEDRTDVYVGATLATPLKGLRLGVAYDESWNTARVGVPALDVKDLTSIAGYVSFQATEKLSLHARAEYVDGQIGSFAYLNGLGTADQVGLDKVFALTGTIQYDLWANVISRLEVRWDHATDGKDAFGGRNEDSAPSKKNDVMVAANIIYKF